MERDFDGQHSKKSSSYSETGAASFPPSTSRPGARINALTLIGAIGINVGLASYSGVAQAQTSLLAKTSGCAATGTPNSNDWVRTCAAQGLPYPQVQNLIQELQTLKHS
jgi:hypothetical protein